MARGDLSLSKPELKALFTKAGGEAGLEAILDDFYMRMSQDILIGYFFAGKDVKHIARMQKQFLMRAMGASESYKGKAPAQAHTELPNILSGHFDRRLRILEAVLADHGLGAEEIRTWIRFEDAFREGIVSDEGPRK